MTRAKTELKIETISIDLLKPNPKNTRRHSPAQIRQIAESIRTFGFNVPLLIDDEMMVVAGHGRLLASQSLGQTELPVIRLRHLTEAQIKAFAIAENRLVETGEWDDVLLGEVLQDLSTLDLDFGLDVTGFTMAEIDLKIEGLSDDDASDADDEPVSPGPTVTQPGDLWFLGDHRLICGSSLESETYIHLLGDDRVAMVFTDPPYNVPSVVMSAARVVASTASLSWPPARCRSWISMPSWARPAA